MEKDGFQIASKKKSKIQANENAYAIDCEMCFTKNGLECCRISVVDANRNVVLDEFIKPTDPILDYNTKYSGITADMLKDVTTTLASVQQKLLKFIHQDTILIGIIQHYFC